MSEIFKIVNLVDLERISNEARRDSRRVIHCHGVFDNICPNQISKLEGVTKDNDLLVATVVRENIGETKPRFSAEDRARLLSGISEIDFVSAVDCDLKTVFSVLKPDLFVSLELLSSKDECSLRACDIPYEKLCGIDFADNSALFFDSINTEAKEFLKTFKKQYSLSDIERVFSLIRPLKVLVLGDIIIDEYHYCKSVGKSSKSATLTAKYLSSERQMGGVLAVANHIAGFVDNVNLLTFIGEPREDEKLIRLNMKPNVKATFVPVESQPIVVKRRYADPFQLNKMFELMWLGDYDNIEEEENRLLDTLSDLLDQCDLAVVADFGHGAVTRRMIEALAKHFCFLAVNTQTNSANFGYNLITKYPRADYICIDEEEMRLANQNKTGDLDSMVMSTAKKLGAKTTTVTRGTHGSRTWSHKNGSSSTPVFSRNVVDSVGAGDAYLSVTSLLARIGVDPQLMGFIGNCAGGLAVRIVGNRESISFDVMLPFIKSLM